MKTRFVIVAFAVLLTVLSDPAFAADEDQVAKAVKQELAKLAGKWETTLRAGGNVIQNVQTIKGTTSTVDRFDEDGNLLQSHTAEFKLAIKDQIRVFTFFDLRVTAGPQAGKGFKGPLSFIYVVDEDVWTEARGLLADQQDGKPRLMFWKRVVKDKVAANRN